MGSEKQLVGPENAANEAPNSLTYRVRFRFSAQKE